jgi:uncharacterized protein YcfJ
MAMCGALLVSGCAVAPPGPTVQVMPPPNKPLDMFQADDAACRGYADGIVKPEIDQANQRMAGQVVIGTLLGVALGAAIGNGAGQAIAAGAASGSIVGAAAGSNAAAWAQLSAQQRYDIAYSQCMYSRGDQVPGFTQQYALPPPPPPPPPHNS